MTLNDQLLSTLDHEDIQDAIRYLDPDLILLTDTTRPYDLDRINRPIFNISRENKFRINNRHLFVTGIDTISEISHDSHRQLILILRLNSPTNSLPECLIDGWDSLPESTVYLSLDHSADKRVPPEINRNQLKLHGIDCPVNDETPYIPLTIVTRSGLAYLQEKLTPDQLGVQAIKGIGRSRGKTLRSGGFETRKQLMKTNPESLLKLEGFGPHFASIAYSGAHAHERDQSYWFNTNPLKDDKVAYVDIETDAGVSVIWQIGVYDEPTDNYQYFIETQQKRDPRSVPRSFARWIYEEIPDRTFVAWYGSGFDFPHLNRFIDQFAENRHAKCWEQTRNVDLLQDIVRARTAVPSRSHKVDVVAARLGYKRAHGGLSGADAARTYQQWLKGIEPDWDRWINYCRDDVIGMKHILDRLRNAPLLFDKRKLY